MTVAPPAPAERALTPILASVGTTTAGVLPSFLAGALAVQMRADLHYDESGLGALTAVFFGAAALASAASGRLAERIGPARGMRVAGSIAAAVLLAIATVVHSWVALALVLAVGGAGNALAQTAANVWLARTVPRERFGLAFGVKQSAIPAAMLLGGLAVPAVALPLGWRWAFALGAAGAAVAVLVVPRALPPLAPAAVEGESSRGPVHLRALLALAVGIGFGAASAGTLGSFSVSASVAAGIGEGAAGLLFALGAAVGLSARLGFGLRADRREGGHLRTVAWLMGIGGLGYLLMATEDAGVIAISTPLVFAIGWGWPGLFNLAIVRRHPDAAGRATGITQTGTYIGAVAGPLLFGFLAAHTTYRLAWTVAAITSACAAVATIAGRRLLRRAVEAEPMPATPR